MEISILKIPKAENTKQKSFFVKQTFWLNFTWNFQDLKLFSPED